MAVVFGKRSGYLAKQRWSLLVAIVLTVAVFWLVLRASSFLSGAGLWAVLAVLAAMLVSLESLRRLARKFYKIDNGMFGENRIVRELQKLPNDFAVFRGLMANEHLDIDCTVVGPTGVFSIEVKSHRGRIGFNGRELTRNGRRLEKDFLAQADAEAVALRDLIRRTGQIDVFVESVIVFSSSLASVHFGPQQIRNSYVVGKRWLADLLTSGTRPLDSENILRIAATLASGVADPRAQDKLKYLAKTLNAKRYEEKNP
jgi:hypothetical protein